MRAGGRLVEVVFTGDPNGIPVVHSPTVATYCFNPQAEKQLFEAGLYVTAGTKVKTPEGEVVSARRISGQSNLLFRRNSQTGTVEVLPTKSAVWGGLNASLHSND